MFVDITAARAGIILAILRDCAARLSEQDDICHSLNLISPLQHAQLVPTRPAQSCYIKQFPKTREHNDAREKSDRRKVCRAVRDQISTSAVVARRRDASITGIVGNEDSSHQASASDHRSTPTALESIMSMLREGRRGLSLHRV